MSHYAVLVVGENVNDMLSPYDENIEVEHIVTREELIEKEKNSFGWAAARHKEYMEDPVKYEEKTTNESHLKYIRDEVPKMMEWTDDEWHKHAIRYYDEHELDDDGGYMSTYNPKSKWDWYSIGGRWKGILRIKPGADSGIQGEGSWTNADEDYEATQVDSALKKDVDWEHPEMKDFCLYALLDDNGWHEKGEMGWFGISTNEVQDWESEFKKLLDAIPDDARITVVDCHI